ncbi:integral membrane sensor signal transduction histidine kinase [Fictibacillus macauensis ZFHKF-1]|uniref:histidine kinase n=1 Tax=Fictibacillus macauensis ZFHKF-1 TaxID=1196324 RepID=I8IZ93_9BACL|nr:sensor histidine kinase [Fictibacillus macauensis]EIT84816.1 integral membrane sensor signal transduction histidine kinase [Fictibacillus macauensis ZFHKF-1]
MGREQREMSLRRTITYKFLVLLIPALLVVYGGMYIFLQRTMYDNAVETSQRLSVEAQTYAMSYLQKREGAHRLYENASLVASYLAKRYDTRVQLFKNQKELLTDTEKGTLPYIEGDLKKALAGKKAYVFKSNNPFPTLLFSSPIYYKDQVVGVIRFVTPLKEESVLLRNLTAAFIGLFILIVVIAMVWIQRVAKIICEPIEQLRAMSHYMTKGNYNVSMPVVGYEEIRQLAVDFKTMARSIQFHIEQLQDEKTKQREFANKITHELKTPITAIMGYVELIPKLSKEQQLECFTYVQTESKRLLQLIHEVLASSRYDRNHFQVVPSMMNVAPLLKDALNVMSLKFQQQHLTVNMHVSDVFVLADYDKTKQVLLNVLDNIVKYSDALHVDITQQMEENYVAIHIEDDGIGMDPVILQQWHDRGKSRRLRSALGNGLGLLICEEIMSKQGGKFSISENKQGGMTVSLRFAIHVASLA